MDRRPPPQAEGTRRPKDVDGPPVGKLFEVKDPSGRALGFFDARACWCTRRADGVKVDRSAPRAVLALLTPFQKKTLRTVQLVAVKQGVR